MKTVVETIGYCSICWFHGMIQANIEIQISSIIFGGIPLVHQLLPVSRPVACPVEASVEANIFAGHEQEICVAADPRLFSLML